jgi:hypothetical protein
MIRPAHPLKLKVYLRAVTAILLLITWGLITLSGIIIYLAPSGFRSGKTELLFGLTKTGWNDTHFWLGITTVAITLIHIIIDWKALWSLFRYLISIHRGPLPTTKQ